MTYCEFQTPCGLCSLKSMKGVAWIRCDECIEEATPIYKSRKYSEFYSDCKEEKPEKEGDAE